MAIGDGGGKAQARVYHQGSLLYRLNLDKDRKIELLDGNMHLAVRNHKISVSRSQCPRNVCVNMGWIGHEGESLVCVPYQILIEVVNAEGKSAVDAVAY